MLEVRRHRNHCEETISCKASPTEIETLLTLLQKASRNFNLRGLILDSSAQLQQSTSIHSRSRVPLALRVIGPHLTI